MKIAGVQLTVSSGRSRLPRPKRSECRAPAFPAYPLPLKPRKG
jgi:hypothetical protein